MLMNQPELISPEEIFMLGLGKLTPEELHKWHMRHAIWNFERDNKIGRCCECTDNMCRYCGHRFTCKFSMDDPHGLESKVFDEYKNHILVCPKTHSYQQKYLDCGSDLLDYCSNCISLMDLRSELLTLLKRYAIKKRIKNNKLLKIIV